MNPTAARARWALLVPLLFAVLALAAPRAEADATITVSSTADPGAGGCTPSNGQCSLREALALVNKGEVSGQVDIVLEAGGTIDVGAAGELLLEPPSGVDAVEIYGPGAESLTIDGGGESRVFRLEGDFLFSLAHVTIAHGAVTDFAVDGEGGAGIFSEASDIDLDGVRFVENRVESDRDGGAIGIEGSAHLTVSDSIFEGNFSERSGGAIFIELGASAYIVKTTLEENEAEERDGGGIAAKGMLTLEESTLADNTAGGAGGAVATAGPIGATAIEDSTLSANVAATGGGLAQLEGETLLRDSTVSANQGGGVHDADGVLIVRNSTIVANTTTTQPGAGVEGDELVLQSTIVAGNQRNTAPADCAGTVSSEGSNLVGAPVGSIDCDWLSGPGDQFGLDPQLGPLGDYGGPTATMPPVSRESPAINSGENPQATDQRGRTRPVPGTAADTDVGAVEVQAPALEAGEGPAISPEAELRPGDELVCEPGGWDVDTVTDASFTYAWRVGGAPAGAGAVYELGNADAGEPIVCEVTVDNGVSAASAESAPVELAPATATIAPDELDFGARRVGTGPSEAQALVVENAGGAELEVTAASTTNDEFPIDASACVGLVLAADESCEVQASFDPAAPGQQGAFVIVETSAGNPVASLSGKATDFTFSAAPSSLDFGDQRVGTSSEAETIVVSNLGDAAMDLGQLELVGAAAADFGLGADDCSEATLLPDEECAVDVVFSPTESGPRDARLDFNGAPSAELPLTGTGIEPLLLISPNPLDYGSHLVGSKSGVQVFVVTNFGEASARIDTVALGGADPGQFELGATDTCTGATLDPDEECAVQATYAPTVLGAAEADLEVAGEAPTAIAELSGEAFGQPGFAAAPTSLDFGPVLVSGGPSEAETVTVTNTGTAAMEIDSVAIEGADAAVFSVLADGCGGATLAPDEECEVELTFDPSAARGYSATLAFAGDAPGVVGLFGTGIAPALTIAPNPLDYGSHLVGTKSGAQTFTVKNVGAAPAALGAVALGGADPGQFELGATDTCTGATLDPDEECAVQVTFAPTAAGPSAATLQVSGDAPASAALSGTGTEPGFSAAPSSIDFGVLAVEDAPGGAEAVVVTNTGSGPLEIGPIFLAGEDPGMFSLADDGCSGVTLAAGASCELDARFVPTNAGEFEASIVFPGTDPGSVALEGVGVAPKFVAEPASVDFGSRQVGSGPGAARTVTVKNDGTAPLTLGAISFAGASPTSFAILAGGDGCSGRTLAPAQTCAVQAVFAPLAPGDVAAALKFPGNAPGEVFLHGFGSAPPPAPPAPTPEPPPAPAPPPLLRLAAHKGPLLIEPNGLAKVALICDSPGGVACKGTVKVKLAKRTVVWRGRIAAGAGRWALFRFGAPVRKALAKKGKLKGLILLSSAGGAGRLKATFKSP